MNSNMSERRADARRHRRGIRDYEYGFSTKRAHTHASVAEWYDFGLQRRRPASRAWDTYGRRDQTSPGGRRPGRSDTTRRSASGNQSVVSLGGTWWTSRRRDQTWMHR